MNVAAPIVALGAVLVVAVARRGHSRAPTCVAWAVPSYVPTDVALRATDILATRPDYGETFEETWAGKLYKFIVETHGPNPQNPRPHKGVGVRVCVRTDGGGR
jgi:hypothetical protein